MKEYLKKISRGENLTREEAAVAMETIATGQASEAETAAFLMGLAVKHGTEAEIVGMVEVLRRHMVRVEVPYDTLDTCGTGGDGAETFNVSTTAAFVCAAAGVKVAKHGNRSVSSKSGSFDVLEALGIHFPTTPEQAEVCLDIVGIVPLFAPHFHPAMKYVGPVRKALGIRTIFNFLGPLLNPAGATYQLVGVSAKDTAQILGSTLMSLGSKRVIIVHSQDGLDEISVAAPTEVYDFTINQTVKIYIVEPEKRYSLAEVRGGSSTENADIMKHILSGTGTEAQNEFVVLNAGMALVAAGKVADFREGKVLAQHILRSGTAMEKVNELIAVTKNF